LKLKWFLLGGGILVITGITVALFAAYTAPVRPWWNSEPDLTSQYRIDNINVSYSGSGEGIDIINNSASLVVTLAQADPVEWKLKGISNSAVLSGADPQYESFNERNIFQRLGFSCAIEIGGPVKTIWTFNALGEGTANVTLECRGRGFNELLETLVIEATVKDRTKQY
jgi:hypothetical protein